MANCRQQEGRGAVEAPPQVLLVREGEPLPEGYTLAVRAPATPAGRSRSTEVVDLSTQLEDTPPSLDEIESAKRKTSEKRNLIRGHAQQYL
jgi:hypothetical protein